jgi:small redox-active disulfide protein 2
MSGTTKKIEILGTGCARCRQLTAAAEAAAQGLGIDYELVKVTAIPDILARGVMLTPALAVDGQVKAAGRIPCGPELDAMLA